MPSAIFYVNGVAKQSANCGDTEVLDIPGYSQIWLTQYQNGLLQYDGPYSLPSPPYNLSCQRDVGTFTGTAYELVNGQKGQVITSWSFVVSNQAAQGSGAGITTPGGQTVVNCLSGLCSPSAPPPSQVISTGGPGPGGTGVYATGGPGPYVAPPTSVPQGAGGPLSPYGGLPGTLPTATAAPVGTLTGAPTTTTAPVTAHVFNLKGFLKSPLFLLLIALLIFTAILVRR